MKAKFLLVALFGAFTLPHQALAFSCSVDYSFPNHSQPHWEKVRKAITTAEQTVDDGLKASIAQATALIVEGKRVTTAQESSSGSDIATGIARNTEQQLAIENAMATHKEVQKVKTEFGVMSSGFDNCKVIKERAKTDEASKDVVKYAVTASNSPNVTARAGHYADRNEAMAVRLALHDKKYCTKEQAESGLCEAEAPRAGNSLIASTLFKSAEEGDENDQDKDALINNMVGLPHSPVPQELSNSATGIAYQDSVRQNGALKSIAIFALKYVQGQTTAPEDKDHDHSDGDSTAPTTEKQAVKDNKDVKDTSETPSTEPDKDNSYVGLVKRDVQRHFGGGEDYIKRRTYIAGATEKGVLVEMNKAQGLLKRQIADLIEKEQIKLSLTAGTTTALMRYTGMDSRVEQKRQEIIKTQVQGLSNGNR